MEVVIYVSHVDDDVLGAGGLIPQMIEAGHEVYIIYVTDGLLHPPKDIDNRPKAKRAGEILGIPEENIYFLGFPNQRFDEDPLIELNKGFERLDIEPDLIITNAKTEVNQDHRMVFESAMVVGRSVDRQIGIMTCEVLSSAEWNDVRHEPYFHVNISNTSKKRSRRCTRSTPKSKNGPTHVQRKGSKSRLSSGAWRWGSTTQKRSASFADSTGTSR